MNVEQLIKTLANVEMSAEARETLNNLLEASKTLQYIYPKSIVFNDETLTLRMPDEDSPKFKQILESIRQPRKDAAGNVVQDHGLLVPISVRPVPGHAGLYALNDGGHRLRAWTIAFGESKPIPAMILPVDDEGVMLAQVQANVLNVKQDKKQLGVQCRRILDNHPEWTCKDLAAQLGVTGKAIEDWMSLSVLPEAIQVRLNKEGDENIPLTVAYILARFTPKSQKDPVKKQFWLEQRDKWLNHYDEIKNEPQGLTRFMGEASAAIKKAKTEMAKKGEGAAPDGDTTNVVVVVPTIRNKATLTIELDRARGEHDKFGDAAKNDAEEFVKTYPDAAAFLANHKVMETLEYVLQVDDKTRQERQAKADQKANEKKAAGEEKKAGKKAESIARNTSFSSLFK